MSYGSLDLVIDQGAQFDRQLELEQADGSPFDITGFTPRVQVFRDGLLMLTSEGVSPSILIDYQPDGVTNAFIFTITAEYTRQFALPYDAGGSLVYYVDLVDALIDTSVIRVLKGALTIERDSQA